MNASSLYPAHKKFVRVPFCYLHQGKRRICKEETRSGIADLEHVGFETGAMSSFHGAALAQVFAAA